jgi:hypothetical protein
MRSRAHILRKKKPLLIGCLLFATFYLFGCNNEPEKKNTRKPVDYIRQILGKNDSISAEVAEKGKF